MSIIPQIKLFVDKGKKSLSDWIKLEMNEFGQIREDLSKRVFQPLREAEEKAGKYEVPFLPKTSALRYWPGEMAKTAGEYLLPQTPLEAGLFAIPFGTLAKPLKPLAKTPVGKKVVGIATKELGEIAPKLFTGLKNISTKLLEKFRSMPTEIKIGRVEEIINKAKKEGIKAIDEYTVRRAIQKNTKKGMVNLTKVASDVEEQLVPLTATPVKSPRWSGIGEDFIGDGKYGEIVYQSPIKTSAGDVHYPKRFSGEIQGKSVIEQSYPNYFSHIRYEDMADGKTRKILETQSDLFQKGRLELEKTRTLEGSRQAGRELMTGVKEQLPGGLAKLEPYSSNDPLAQLRTFREEVKRAAKDGKDTLLIPSGETAMKIEGLGEQAKWFFTNKTGEGTRKITSGNLTADSIGKNIVNDASGNDWIITDILGEGKFKAMPKEHFDSFAESKGVQNLSGEDLMSYAEQHATKNFWGSKETFDISGKVDTQHFVYKLNEEAIPREARKMGLNVEGKINVDNGDWWKIKIPPERAGMPIEAFGAIPLMGALQQNQADYNKNKTSTIPFIPNQQLFINK